MPLTHIEPRRLYRQIAEQIRGLITSGEYSAGARLPPERDLAKQLRVSRPSVREALIALEVEGLVEVRVGSGIYIRVQPHGAANGSGHARITQQSGPFEVIRARRAIEGECAALAAKEGKRAQVVAIGEALAQMKDDATNMAQPLEADRLFHLRIAEATNNGALVQVVKNLWDERGSPLFTQLEHHFDTPKDWAKAIDEHDAVIKAVKSRDPDAARVSMHAHLDGAAKRLSRSWDGK
ncbi:MAG: FadR/GntR family transcriptional regulator [Casimicrobiaceae bacterium]